MPAARPQKIGGARGLNLSVALERHGDVAPAGLDRDDFRSELHFDALLRKAIAKHRLGAPLRLAALEFVFAAEPCKLGEPDARLAWTEKLDLFDAHTAGEKRLDDAASMEHFEQGGLEPRATDRRSRRTIGPFARAP